MYFYDVGALVYFAKIIEWEFPGFSVDACFGNLCKLQKELDANGFIKCTVLFYCQFIFYINQKEPSRKLSIQLIDQDHQ